jgi:tetratricopeptide (TPR) repeat protein
MFVVLAVLLVPACAARAPVMPPEPATPRHPDFVYPDASGLAGSPAVATQIERGWRHLQSDNLRSAEREFVGALKPSADFPPAQTALGYLALARDDSKAAVGHFDRALGLGDYVPALVGRGQALLALRREGEALASFETALAARPDIPGLQGRVEVLRFRAVQDNLARATSAADARRWDDARAAYAQAIAASPESAFLYRELGTIELRSGRPDEAMAQFQRALELDPRDALAHAAVGALLSERGDAAGARDAYEAAAALDPSAVSATTLASAREAAMLAELPAEFRAIPDVDVLTRGDLAALVGVRLAPLVSAVRPRPVVITDVRDHWAQPWITAVVRAGVMETQPNYTFQPGEHVRRGDVAQTVNRTLALIALQHPELAMKWQGAPLQISDLPQGHLAYPAVSAAVAAGVMRLLPDGTFQLLRPVSGAEAVEIVGRLQALAEP